MNDISFVLPLKINTNPLGSDLERIKKILLPSLVKYFEVNRIRCFLIIVPSREYREVCSQLKEFMSILKLSVVPEQKILDMAPGWKQHIFLHRVFYVFKEIDFKFNNGKFFEDTRLKKGWKTLSGWYKQQLLKMFASKLIDSEYYMTLDADLCLTRPTDVKTLFPDGKAIFTPEIVEAHRDWWVGSSRVLNIELKLKPEDSVINVTPEILSREVVSRLIDYLMAKARQNKFPTVFEYLATVRPWTEYTLYWLFLLEFYKMEDYYTNQMKVATLHRYHSVWERHEAPNMTMLREHIHAAFHDPSALFLVTQSSCVSLIEYCEAIKEYLA